MEKITTTKKLTILLIIFLIISLILIIANVRKCVIKKREKERRSLLMEQLKEDVEGYITENCLDGTFSVYVEDLTCGLSFSINNYPMYPSSVAKVFIMGAVYEQIEEGNLEMTDSIMSYLENMIIYSDNYSANELILTLGGHDAVNDFCDKYGYNDTTQYHGYAPADNSYLVPWIDGLDNVSTAKDIGSFLSDLYKGNIVSAKASSEMIELLKRQYWVNKIPALLPEGTVVANKTGEAGVHFRDGGIVYSPNNDYVISILFDSNYTAEDTYNKFAEVSKIVYDGFNE